MSWEAARARLDNTAQNLFCEKATTYLVRADGNVPGRVIIDRAAKNGDGMIYSAPVLTTVRSDFTPELGETIVVGIEAFQLDSLISDDGYAQEWLTLPGQAPPV